MKIRKFILLFFFASVVRMSFSQDTDSAVYYIDQHLDFLAESLSPGLKEIGNFSVVETPLHELFRGIAEVHHLNINVDPQIQNRITNNFTNVKIKDLILFLKNEFNLEIKFQGNIISFYRKKEPQREIEAKMPAITVNDDTNNYSFDLSKDSLSVFAKYLTQLSRRNVVIAPGTPDKPISGFILDSDFDLALEKIAYVNGLKVKKNKDGFYVIENVVQNPVNQNAFPQNDFNNGHFQGQLNNRPANRGGGDINFDLIVHQGDTLINLDVLNAPIVEVIKQVSTNLGKNYVLFSEPPGNNTSFVKNIKYEDLLSFLLQASTHTYKKKGSLYLVGDRTQEGFRNTRLVKLQFRAVEDIDKSIPSDLSKNVDIKVFKELNSLILSGGEPQILELVSFINAIDQPVPNILIEVIVADVRKSISINTGIRAGLSDSTVTSSGNIFPGVDARLSSSAINSLIDRIGPNGLVNIGRVSPRFYVDLKALEENSDIDIKSTPQLSTLNGHEANLIIGQSRYYAIETPIISGGVAPITTVTRTFEQVEANLNIKINPFVSGNDHITLKIEAEFADFIEPVIEGAPPGSATRKFISQIRVNNEDMIILGGLEEARKQNSSNGLPLISRIPVLNWIFSSRTKVKSDSRLIVFIKPTIVY